MLHSILTISILISFTQSSKKSRLQTSTIEELALHNILHSYTIKDSDGMPIFRKINGWSNNIKKNNLKFGASKTPHLRLMEAKYNDKIGSVCCKDRQSPRFISNIVSNNPTIANTPNIFGLTAITWQWGQFLDHDMTETPQNMTETMEIIIPDDDDTFIGFKVLKHQRSTKAPETGTNENNKRNQINTVTSYIDGSTVYGSDAEREHGLREHKDGLLKTYKPSDDIEIMPFNTEGLENLGGNNRPDLHLAGDIRANEQIGLFSMHTLWVREHNRLARIIKKLIRIDDDELIYQLARSIVIAEIQQVTYNEFLPALFGSQMDYYIPPYEKYNDDLDATIASIFSTGTFRLGHTLLNNMLPIREPYCKKSTKYNDMKLEDAFFKLKMFQDKDDDVVGMVLEGLTCISANEVDPFIINDVRDNLFKDSTGVGQAPIDLISLNLDRGRDHAIPDYNSVRGYFNLPKLTKIDSNTFINPSELNIAYDDVNNMDLFIGGLSEKHLPGSNLGETFSNILADQFTRLRDGDRFYFERYFKGTLLEYLKSVKLKDIIEKNTRNYNLQDWVMFAPNMQPERPIKGAYGDLKTHDFIFKGSKNMGKNINGNGYKTDNYYDYSEKNIKDLFLKPEDLLNSFGI